MLYVSSSAQVAGGPVLLKAGEGATFRIVAQASAPVRHTFATGQRYDIRIEREGRTVWRWAAGRMFTQATFEQMLSPEAPWEFRERWNGLDLNGKPLAPGRYRVVAALLGVPEDGAGAAPVTADIEVR